MAANGGSKSAWSTDFDTLRREKLFRNPPENATAYPDLQEAFRPHIDSFDAVFEDGGSLDLGIKDIGIKSVLDGNPDIPAPVASRNELRLRISEIFLEKSMLPRSNKFSTRGREIHPAECRERHSTYRGVFQARLEVQLNDGEWQSYGKDLGRLPLMLRVS